VTHLEAIERQYSLAEQSSVVVVNAKPQHRQLRQHNLEVTVGKSYAKSILGISLCLLDGISSEHKFSTKGQILFNLLSVTYMVSRVPGFFCSKEYQPLTLILAAKVRILNIV
jgi:hypothetical protein